VAGHHRSKRSATDAKLNQILLSEQGSLAAYGLGVSGFHMCFSDAFHLNKTANGFGNAVANTQQAMAS
jgi:hypothetical protein